MVAGKFGASMVTCIAVAMLVAFSASVSGVQAKSDSRVLNVVETQDVERQIVIEMPSLQELEELLLTLPEDVRNCIIELAGEGYLDPVLWLVDNVQTIIVDIDGKAHINMMAWERSDSLEVNCHFSWHGVIAMTFVPQEDSTDLSEPLLVTLDMKNAQFIAHATLVWEAPYIADLMVNAHVNGDATIGLNSEDPAVLLEFDLSSHLLLKISDGELQMLKIWIPSWLDAVLAEI
jgi:hypothetical protein